MKKLFYLTMMLCYFFAFTSCDEDDNYPKEVIIESNFEFGLDDWIPFFSEYPEYNGPLYELSFVQKALPAPLNEQNTALYISGNNKNDNLMMFGYLEVSGLKHNAEYVASFDIDVVSNASSVNDNYGNPSLMLGVGGLSYRPQSEVFDGILLPNFESRLLDGNSSSEVKTLGRIGVNSTGDTYKMQNMNNKDFPLVVYSDEDGRVWLLVGMHSHYRSTSAVYLDRIDIKLVKQ